MKGKSHPNNKLNDLTGKDWLKFTRTWFICDSRRYWKNKDTELHPARYPEEMVKEFISFFTKKHQLVLDPFLGSGSTLIACKETGRDGIGIELTKKYSEIAKKRVSQQDLFNTKQKIIHANALDMKKYIKEKVDFIITSPPYWNMLKKSRGNVKSAQKIRDEKGLDTHYSENKKDLGNLEKYEDFIEALGKIFDKAYDVLKDEKYMVIVIQNLRTSEGFVRPLAWVLQKRVSKKFKFMGEKIWCQNTKKLGIWGYPSVFVPNYHHHYCLIFKKF